MSTHYYAPTNSMVVIHEVIDVINRTPHTPSHVDLTYPEYQFITGEITVESLMDAHGLSGMHESCSLVQSFNQ